MTPCKELGYKVGDKFKIKAEEYFCAVQAAHGKDIELTLLYDDGTSYPKFCVSHKFYAYKDNPRNAEIYEDDYDFIEINSVQRIEDNHPSLEDAFKTFLNSLGAGHNSELSIKKDKYTLYFDNYEFDGDEARIHRVIELLTELHIKGK